MDLCERQQAGMLRNVCGLNISDDIQRHGLILSGYKKRYGFNYELLRPFHMGHGSRECLVHFQWETCGKRRRHWAQAVLVHPKSCRFHEHGSSRQAPPKIKIFYLFVSGSGVGFNQSENWLLTTTCNISLMKISVNPTGIPGVVWSIKISEI